MSLLAVLLPLAVLPPLDRLPILHDPLMTPSLFLLSSRTASCFRAWRDFPRCYTLPCFLNRCVVRCLNREKYIKCIKLCKYAVFQITQGQGMIMMCMLGKQTDTCTTPVTVVLGLVFIRSKKHQSRLFRGTLYAGTLSSYRHPGSTQCIDSTVPCLSQDGTAAGSIRPLPKSPGP